VPGVSWQGMAGAGNALSGDLQFQAAAPRLAHGPSDTITVTADAPVRMCGAVFGLSGPGTMITQSWPIPVGKSTAAKATRLVLPDGGDVVSFIASANGTPNDPVGFARVGVVSGGELYAVVSWARQAAG
jgi:hypothetical protein